MQISSQWILKLSLYTFRSDLIHHSIKLGDVWEREKGIQSSKSILTLMASVHSDRRASQTVKQPKSRVTHLESLHLVLSADLANIQHQWTEKKHSEPKIIRIHLQGAEFCASPSGTYFAEGSLKSTGFIFSPPWLSRNEIQWLLRYFSLGQRRRPTLRWGLHWGTEF